MTFKKFSEYLNQKGKMQDKPIIDPLADTSPVPPKKPEKNVTKGKTWRTEAAELKDGVNGTEPEPYSNPTTDPGQQKYEKGLVDKGNQDLVYKPKAIDQPLKTDIKKTKTEQFIEKTKDMAPNEYAEFILNSNNGPDFKKIMEVTKIIANNEPLMESLVREIKRKEGFNKLIEVILAQPETYTEIAIALANESKGKEISSQLAQAINEITAPPESEDDDEVKPRKTKSIKGQPIEMGKDNVLASKKQYAMMKPEHHLIEALMKYNNIKDSIKNFLS